MIGLAAPSSFSTGSAPAAQRAERTLPALLLLFSIVAAAVHAAVPWKVVTVDGGETEVVWAHGYAEHPFLADGFFSDVQAPDPTDTSLAGVIVGAGLAIVWLLLASVSSRAVLTRRREAALLALAAIPAFLFVTAGARGLGQALQFNSIGRESAFGFSVAGVALLVLGGLMTMALVGLILARVPERRAAVTAILLAVLATGLFHAVPWLATTGDGPESYSLWRDVLASAPGRDLLGSVEAGIITLLVIAVAWLVLAALVAPAGRVGGAVDGVAALALAAPVLLIVSGAGKFLAFTIAGALDTRTRGAQTVNGYVLLGLALILLVLAAVTAARSARPGEEARA